MRGKKENEELSGRTGKLSIYIWRWFFLLSRLSLFYFPALVISVTEAGILNTKGGSGGYIECKEVFFNIYFARLWI